VSVGIVRPKYVGPACPTDKHTALSRPIGHEPRTGALCDTAFLKIDHAHDHGPLRIEWQVLEAPPRVEGPHTVVDRMCDDAEASDLAGSAQRRSQREQQERPGVPSALMRLIDRELSKQRDRNRIGLVALLLPGKKLALNLRGAQCDEADDAPARGITDDVGARNSRGVIVPGVAVKPAVQGVAPAIEVAAVIVFGERPGRRYVRHVGGRSASSFTPAISRAGFAAHASNRAQSLAGIVTILRSNRSASAASNALRRTKSLRLVRACEDAASNRTRS
jgi:hypothetical protein